MPGEVTRIDSMRLLVMLVSLAMFIAAACGDGSPTAGSPTATPTPTALPTLTATPTPTLTATPTPTQPGTPSPDVTSQPPTATPTPTITPNPTTTPSLSPQPTASPPLYTPMPTPTPVDIAEGVFPTPPERDLYELARSLRLKRQEPIPPVVNPEPVSYTEGRVDTFWLIDMSDVSVYSSEFELRLVSPRAYWYVERGLNVLNSDLERAAAAFEEQIYPRVTEAMGREWSPGVDNDVHLTILNGRLGGGAGYFSSVDEHPISVHPYSNQREMVYMSAEIQRVGSSSYLSTLAHEFQHVAHWFADPGEETWMNEGLAELASSIAGYEPNLAIQFLRSPIPSLIHWSLDPFASQTQYGQSFLFFHYLSTRFGDDLAALIADPRDGVEGIDAFLASLGSEIRFREVFADWLVASLLDEPGDGPYSHPGREVGVSLSGTIEPGQEWEASIPQYAAEYVALGSPQDAVTISFDGQVDTPLLPVAVGPEGCWWSNRGDVISSTLTRRVDLSGATEATLIYRVWYDLEEGWDYGYVEVSRDGGSTWDVLPAPGSSPRNPVGNSFGPGYTGASGGWLEEEVDLSPYAGEEVLLRLQYVTDDAINGSGLCFDDIAIPEIGFSDAVADYQGWQTEGFVHTQNHVPQEFIVQVVESGVENRVTTLELDENNHGQLVLSGDPDRDGVAVIVATLAPQTLQKASYTLAIQPTG